MSVKEITIKDKIFVPFIFSGEIQERVAALARQINHDYGDQNPLVIGVLTGSVMFASDVFRLMNHPCELTFIRVASYHGGLNSSGTVTEVLGLKEDISNRHVLVLEDIIDTGETVFHLLDYLKKHNPASLKIATALFKPTALKRPVKPDYIGFEVGPEFLVGYGLDYDGLGRNLKDIYVLKT